MGVTGVGWEGLFCAGKSSGPASQGKSPLGLGPVPFNLSFSLMRLARCWRPRPPLEAADRNGSSLRGAPSFHLLKGPSP